MSDEVKYYPFKIGGVEQIHPNVHPGTPKYAAGIVVGNLAFLSGMTPQSTEDGSCLTVGVEAQVFACLDKVRAVLEEMGSSMENIVKTVILLKDLEYYQQMRAAELQVLPEVRAAPRLGAAGQHLRAAGDPRPPRVPGGVRRHRGREARVALPSAARRRRPLAANADAAG